MSTKIHYVSMSPVNWDSVGEREDYKNTIAGLAAAIRGELEEKEGFLRLVYRETGVIFYYNSRICGILGDMAERRAMSSEPELPGSMRVLLKDPARIPSMELGHLKSGVLRFEEYQTLFQNEAFDRQWKKWGWQNVLEMGIMVAEPVRALGPMSSRVSCIPIFRCREQGWPVAPDMASDDLAIQLLLHGFVPAEYSGLDEEAWQKLRRYLEKYYGGLSSGEDARPSVIMADPAKLKEIKKYYSEKDMRAADLPAYDDTFFQKERGCWDLYPFAGLQEVQLKGMDQTWYEVTGLYARNPVDDLASSTAQVGIDFGTKSTTVAIYDESGDITMIPVGGMKENDEKAFENPTILEFRDVSKFLAAYRQMEYRPDTDFNDIPVSHPALDDYENKGMRQDGASIPKTRFLNHLKQWANSPGSVLEATDSKGEEITLEHDQPDLQGEALNPIELYAYYIGRNINNMHHGKIYLQYLLSYSATYAQKNLQWIRDSFERGIRKSLPQEVAKNEKLMKGFRVQLWRDEATAYAVSAVGKYLEEEFRGHGEEGACSMKTELENGGIFYGIYDFGGGTLDFGFGLMRQEGERDVYRQLKRGGSPYLGCENILEELAYDIFCREENRNLLRNRNIKCEKPFLYGLQQNQHHISGHSVSSCYNTCSMISYLREIWISNNYGVAIRLQDESGGGHQAQLVEKQDIPSSGKPKPNEMLQLLETKREVEDFFREKILLGIRLFLQHYMEVVKANKELADKKCFILLAGNASRSDRVKDCFKEELEAQNLSGTFCIRRELPTDSDQERHLLHPEKSVPTAKSGVVFGLLYSRPYAENIEVIDEAPPMNFLYYIGRRKRDRSNERGMFQPLVCASQVPTAKQPYRYLMQAAQPYFDLLYTDDGSYGLEAYLRPVGYEVKVMAVRIPERFQDWFLYIRAERDSVHRLRLGVSPEKSDSRDEVTEIAVCDFSKANFETLDPEERAEACESGDTGKAEALGNICPEVYAVCIRDQGEILYRRQISAEEKIRMEHIFTTNADCLELSCERSDGEAAGEVMVLKLGDPGVGKEVHLLKNRGSKLGIGCMVGGERKALFEIDMAKGLLEGKGQNGVKTESGQEDN